ncbi:MAG TPA: DUF4384 domain-containing protein [Chroococcales cyanobacterium]
MRSTRSIGSVVIAACLLVAPAGLLFVSDALAAPKAEPGRKGLFLQEPLAVQYWLEVARNGKGSRVNNKFAFKSGDQLRIHLKSSVNGYAYIVLRTKDSKQVLFPADDSTNNTDNSVMKEQWINLPKHGALQFDNDAGVEKVSIIVSKRPINPNASAGSGSAGNSGSAESSSGSGHAGSPGAEQSKPKPRHDVPVAEIAMADIGGPKFENVEIVALNADGNKDLVPRRVFVAYNDVPAPTIAHLEPVESPIKTPAAGDSVKTSKSSEKVHAHHPSKQAQVSERKAKVVAHAMHTHSVTHINADLPETWKPTRDMGVVTIESTDPRGIIAAEISLKHEQ